ncbi:MAG: Unknown protein [uncultured Sulfurovum sp.]|uniref:Glycosyltransferase n=1 Tax=uncultured Sulfurovum sp. TaxID=269237 RepID=A0A6S6THW6_9BACT|nr:MAG: Unknown protein [uncultured Sulfurovum sp.]
MNIKVKIVFFLATLNAGGAERVTVTQIRQLDSSKYDIYLILVNKQGPFLELIPKEVKIIDLKKTKTLFSILSLRRVLKDINPDIIYSTLFRTHVALDLALINLKHKFKTIYMSPSSPKLLFLRKEIGFLMRYLIKKAYMNSYMVLAQTPEMKEEIARYHQIDKDKIKVFLNPIDTEMIDIQTTNIENPFNPKRINIVAAGRLSDVKGFDILIDALAKVLEENNNFSLYIIGRDAGEEDTLKKQAERLSISNYVNFLGYRTNPFKFFFFSDLFVLSSRREGLPNVVLENIYMKKPVIATRCVPYMSELIDDGVSGLLVDIEDANSLAEAILNYKKIDVEKYTYMQKIISVNEFFTDIFNERYK